MPRRIRRRSTLLTTLASLVLVACTGGGSPSHGDTAWRVGQDTSSEAPSADARHSDCTAGGTGACLSADAAVDSSGDPPPACPADEMWNPTTGECVAEPETDGGVGDVPVPDDVPQRQDAEPVEPAGQEFGGPLVTSSVDTAVSHRDGVGLYWQSALSQFGDEALHRHLPNRPVVHLSAITDGDAEEGVDWTLPDEPAESRHFYRQYCAEAGEERCAEEGIDDEQATFALIMVGLHEAPEHGRASECTYGLIHGKTHCEFGRTLAPSPSAMILYAYRDFETQDYPLFEQLGLSAQGVPEGYHFVFLPSSEHGPGFWSFRFNEMQSDYVPFDSSAMFPMLYP